VEIPFAGVASGATFPRFNSVTRKVLPPFKNIRDLSLVNSEHLSSLIKVIHKNINICNVE
jgi:hypothetical protein